ncbi:MAG: NUDIX domain-containing protein [Candidatus Magasanikbacteria bacterium]
MHPFSHPRVGVGVIIQNENGEVLLGLRKGSHGAGEWCLPGGSLEFGETLFEVAKREVLEETGLSVSEFELISVSDELKYIESDGKHYVTMGFKATYEGGEPVCVEPEKCEEWKWFPIEELPSNMLEGTQDVFKNYKAGKIYQSPK